MKFFHLADLHLGKSIYEHSLLPDQRQVLDQVAAAVRAESPAAVIIAGDVFDRAVPPPEAVRLFGDFLGELKSIDPDLVIAVIPGNHDSAARLSFASGILGLSGVHIRADATDAVNPVVIHHDGELARLWLLPFLSPGSLTPEMLPEAVPLTEDQPSPTEPPLLRSQADLFAAAISMIRVAMSTAVAGDIRPRSQHRNDSQIGFASPGASNRKNGTTKRLQPTVELDFGQESEIPDTGSLASAIQPSAGQASAVDSPSCPPASDILVCHAFAAGGAAGESERVFLGSAELVDPTLFDVFDYVALGHLHRSQSAGAKGRYAGSPIAYAFSEAQVDRGFLVVDVRPGSFSSELRLVKPLRRMVRISGSYDQVLQDPGLQDYEGAYVEAILDDAEAILNPMGPLRERFPFLLSLKQAVFDRGLQKGQDVETGLEGELDGTLAEDDFIAFHQELRGCPPDPKLMDLFAELYREATNEAP
jgi:exonuclease SbcD